MTINDKIKHEKIQYNINKEATKILAVSSGKVNKFKYLIFEEILSSNQSRISLHILQQEKHFKNK